MNRYEESHTSSDGTTFTKINSGGANPGLTNLFGANYDIDAVMLVGTTYYVYASGSGDHGVLNVYISTDDLQTFTAYSGNPIFSDGTFCPTVWNYDGYYYMLLPRDIIGSGNTLYNHGIALYRSTSPTFDLNNRQYLGYAIVNDKSYDGYYLDTPEVPTTDIYRTTYPSQFGNVLYMLYAGAVNGSLVFAQSLATTTLSQLSSLTPIPESPVMPYGGNASSSYGFWVQFDSLTSGEEVFSLSVGPTISTPAVFALVKTSGANEVLSLYLNGYRYTSPPLAINTPYHIVIVNNGATNHQVYLNGVLVGTFAYNNGDLDITNLYIGEAGNITQLHGYISDFRMYPQSLTSAEVSSLYTTGSIDTAAPTNGSISINSGAISTNSRNVTLTTSATDPDGSSVYQMELSEDPSFSGASYQAYATSASFTLSLGDGAKTVYARFKDGMGHQSASSSASIFLDTTPPSISITSPANLATVSSTIPVTATATSTAGIASVQFYLDGSPLGAAVTSSPYTTSWNTASAANASHTLYALATDSYSNIASSTSITTDACKNVLRCMLSD